MEIDVPETKPSENDNGGKELPTWTLQLLNKGGVAAAIVIIWFIFLQPMKNDFNEIRKEVSKTSSELTNVKHSLDKAVLMSEVGRKEIAKGVDILSKAVISREDVRKIIETEFWGEEKVEVYRRIIRLEAKVGIKNE